MTDADASMLESLFWYLETRDWAFWKIKTCPVGSQLLDVKMHHYLYFANLLAAVDLLHDHLGDSRAASSFLNTVRRGFGATDNYQYVRELRDAIIYRRLDPAANIHANGSTIFVPCPAQVSPRGEPNRYTCTFRYTVELAECCNRAVNMAIFEVLDRHGFLRPNKTLNGRNGSFSAGGPSAAMPDMAKIMSQNALIT